MNREEIIAKLKKANQPEEYIMDFLDFCGGDGRKRYGVGIWEIHRDSTGHLQLLNGIRQ